MFIMSKDKGNKLLYLLIIFLVLTLLPINNAYAASDMVLKDFKVDIWPEYDDPRVLGIYQGAFINNGSEDFNGYVKFNIPKNAKISMACEIVNGNHLCQPYKTEDKGDYVELSWKTTKNIQPGQVYPVFLEFYYDPLVGEIEKSFEYIFRPSYNIKTFDLKVKEPLRTEEFVLEPKTDVSKVDKEGFTNYLYTFSELTPDTNITLNVQYVKKDNEPSIVKGKTNGGSVQNSNNSELNMTEAWKNPMILIMLLIVSLILIGFIYYAFLINKNKKKINLSQSKKSGNKSTNPKLLNEKKKLRKMLMDGKISEQMYRELVMELEDEYMG